MEFLEGGGRDFASKDVTNFSTKAVRRIEGITTGTKLLSKTLS